MNNDYRLELGHLYRINSSGDAYMHCWRTDCTTLGAAINEYERYCDSEGLTY